MSFVRATELALAVCIATAFPPLAAEPSAGGVSMDSLFWDGPLGVAFEESAATFRVFAPRAVSVTLHLYGQPFEPAIASYPMEPASQGCWDLSTVLPADARYYAYAVTGSPGAVGMYDPAEAVADPYSRAVVTENHYSHRGRTLLRPPGPFDWEGDTWVTPNPEDLVIYEAHVRDMTRHPSSGVPDSLRGTYLGLCHDGAEGGLSYLRELGVTAVELLPVQEFGNLEIAYRDSSTQVFNTWNPYARNHWGYMTSYFFAPEAYYATGQALEPGGVCGADGRQVNEFKQLVKTLHRDGMAVILDVVYNHVSQYDLNPLKLIDSEYYFRFDENGEPLSLSGCGNDFKTERPMARRLIVDSVLYWMQEFHIDGFRFDLATMIDDGTLAEITHRAREVNPRVILIAEPWGGGEYDLGAFSRLGWSVWNDRIRNGIKGRQPGAEPGFVFGAFLSGEDAASVTNHLMGSVRSGGGPLLWPWHAVNYLESHDDLTMGDFIRISLGLADPHAPVGDIPRHVRLTPQELRIHRLAALALCCSQGSIMLAQGQEFARAKVIAQTTAPDSMVGRVDHNSYAKDNETNWLDYDHARLNRSLVDYYRSLLRLRKLYRGLGGAPPELVSTWATGDSLCVGLLIASSKGGDPGDLLVILNGAPRTIQMEMPEGDWRPLVVGERVWDAPGAAVGTSLSLPRTTGALLIRER
ncbi:MAG: alpha-amylase family glycosyl hydrolase [Candidatus Eisenbacteria bacterium]|nr:alpha-amylase family glycosyl hydrolase [Candidatus Eisenbacteria bacterium]